MAALAALALCLGGGTIWQLFRYLRPTEVPGEVGIASVPEPQVVSPWLPISAGLFLTAVLSLIFFFKFSDKFPTKYTSRRIS